MLRKRRELGEGNFGCLIGVILMLVAGVVAYKMIPVKVKAADMREAITNEARSAATHHDDAIEKAILRRASDLELPITEDNIKINRSNNNIKIEVHYTVPVDFPGYTYQWNFDQTVENPIF